jgi:hypothetical protein
VRVLFHFMLIVPIAALAFVSFLIAIAWGSMRDAVAIRVPVSLNTGEEARRRIRRI